MATHDLKGILLDIDGTLLDSNDAHAAAFTRAFAEHGLDIPFDHVRPLVGMGSDKLIPSLTGFEHDTRDGKAIIERKKGIFVLSGTRRGRRIGTALRAAGPRGGPGRTRRRPGTG